jgi:PAS domain S-box-containing protein
MIKIVDYLLDLYKTDTDTNSVFVDILKILNTHTSFGCGAILKQSTREVNQWSFTASNGIDITGQMNSWHEFDMPEMNENDYTAYVLTSNLESSSYLKSVLTDGHVEKVLVIKLAIDNGDCFALLLFNKDVKFDEQDLPLLNVIAKLLVQIIQYKLMKNEIGVLKNNYYNQQSYYHEILDYLPVDVVVFDLSHRYEYINFRGMPNPEVRNWIIGKTDYEYCLYRNKPISIAENRRVRFDEVLKSKKEATFVESYHMGTSKERFHLRAMYPVLDEEGNITRVIGYGLDFTEKIKTDRQLQQLSSAIESSPDGIALLTNDGKYFYMNRAHESMFGYERGELIGKTWHVFYKPDMVKYIEDTVLTSLSTNGYWSGEVEAINKAKKFIYQDLKLKILDDGIILCVTRDVSEFKKSLKQLSVAKQKLDIAIQASKIAMWEWNIENDVLTYNQIFENITGFKGNSIHKLLNKIHPEDYKKVADTFNDLTELSTNMNSQIEYRICKSPTNIVWVLDIRSVTEVDFNNMPSKIVGIMIDITETKKLEKEMIQTFNKQQELVDLKTQFISMASHEFRTPLANIKSSAELFELIGTRDKEFNSVLDKYNLKQPIKDIIIEVDRINLIISDIFTIGKIEATQITTRKSVIEVERFFKDYIENEINKVPSRSRVKVSLGLSGITKKFKIDKQQIVHVFNNLIDNAIKYSSPDKPVLFNISYIDGYCKATIEDKGIGISKDDLQHVLTKFYRGKNAKNIPGTGLGMAVAKYFLDANHSSLDIISELNKGTKVTVMVPII